MADFDAYPMPRVDTILDKVASAKYINTIDLMRGYWQIPLEEDSRRKSAFVTEFGLYEFNTMPFGLHGAPARFQRLMDRVLRGAEEFSDTFLDDIAVFSDTWKGAHPAPAGGLNATPSGGIDGKAQEDPPRHAIDYSVGLHCGERREDAGTGQDGGHF